LNDVIVSVRMPRGLVTELKQLAKRNHFMDISEAIRSILRQKYLNSRSAILPKGTKDLIGKLKKVLEGDNES